MNLYIIIAIDMPTYTNNGERTIRIKGTNGKLSNSENLKVVRNFIKQEVIRELISKAKTGQILENPGGIITLSNFPNETLQSIEQAIENANSRGELIQCLGIF